MNFRRRLSNRHRRPRRMLTMDIRRTPTPDLCESRRRAHSPIGVLRMSIVNILRGFPCRLESLRLNFTNEPSIYVDGDLAESIKRSASDRLGDLVPQVRARTFPGFFTTFGFWAFKFVWILFTVLYRLQIRVFIGRKVPCLLADTSTSCLQAACEMTVNLSLMLEKRI